MDEFNGGIVSPGGFTFGVQGWSWGTPRPTTITFFTDNTAMVCDQHGRPIKGTEVDGKKVKFAITPPKADGSDIALRQAGLATHLQVVEALEAENIDWKKLTSAGWPQLPYEKLKQLKELPVVLDDTLEKIGDMNLRRDAMRIRKERTEKLAKELAS